MNKLLFACIAALILFAGCSTSNKFASGFGKRRYNKGFYVDVPAEIKAVAPIVAKVRVPVRYYTIPNIVVAEKSSMDAAICKQDKPDAVNNIRQPVTIARKIVGIASAGNKKTLHVLNNRHFTADDPPQATSQYSFTSVVFFLVACLLYFSAVRDAAQASFYFFKLLGDLFSIIFGVVFNLVAITLAIIAIYRDEKYKLIAVLGLLVNVIFLFALIFAAMA